jgi:DNA-binding SARP family transcriptional activator
MIRLRTLGELALESDSGRNIACVLQKPKIFALLTYLASRRWILHQRDALLAMFWPEATEEHARNCLRQSLYILRHSLGEEVIICEGRTLVGIDPGVLCCDIHDFRDALAANQRERVLALYRGDFLDGFFIHGAAEFERWVDGQQAWCRDRAVRAAWTLAEDAEREGDRFAALRWWGRVEELSPYDEAVVRRLIQSLLRTGAFV